MMNKILLLFAMLTFSFCIKAEVLIIERINNTQAYNTPTKGMSMNQVIQQFGEPVVKNKPVGAPPITKWNYQNFTVYFERSWVISSVMNKASPNEVGPKKIIQ